MEAGKGSRQVQEALVRKEFADAGWQTERLLEAMADAPDFYFHVIQQIKMDKWSSNRIICLGDTAYSPSPLTGMGTTLAIIGGYVLAGELSRIGNDTSNITRALKAYEDKFRPFVEEYQKVPLEDNKFIKFPALVHPASAWKRWVLQSVVWGVSKLVAIPWVVKMLEGDGVFDDQGFPLPEYAAFDKEECE